MSTVAGVAVVGVLLVDIFGTVFVPNGGPGPVTRRIYPTAWWMWKKAATVAPRRLRRRVLALGGPLLLPLTVAVWIGLLLVGFALIYLPTIDRLALPQPEAGSATWIAAIYFSGYSVTTLGVGDVYATTGALRMLSVVEAMLGFSLFSISITYVLSVYGALATMTSLSRLVTRFSHNDPTGPVGVLAALQHQGGEEQLVSWLSQVYPTLHRAGQGQAHYPLLHYFHLTDDDSALPMALPDLLEILTVARALLDPTSYPAVVSGPMVAATYTAATAYTRSQVASLRLTVTSDPRWSDLREGTYRTARRQLTAAGVATRTDHEARERYLRLRAEWDVANAALRRHFDYPAPV